MMKTTSVEAMPVAPAVDARWLPWRLGEPATPDSRPEPDAETFAHRFIELHLAERDSLDITGKNIRQRGSDYGPPEGNAIPTLRRIEWRE